MKKKTIVIGLGVSGRSCVELLLTENQCVLALDQKESQLRSHPQVQALLEKGLILENDHIPIDFKEIQQVILSPGISFSHPLVQQAIQHHVEVIGEIEFAFRHLKNRCIGVTGTNGKTTVVMLIQHILQYAGIPAQSLGNIGRSLCSYVSSQNPNDVLVVELSSYQLETLQSKCLDFAVILNITPDHLDRYHSMENYAKAKCKIEECLRPDGELWVSKQVLDEYSHLLRNASVFENEMQNPSIATISPMRYIQLGVPERQNVLAAYPICRHFGVTDVQFFRGLETFRKPKHRIEFVGEWDGISFYNDSKATNIDSVMHAVGLFEGPIVLLAGGVHKGASYRPWVKPFQGKVKRIVAFGQSAPIIEEDLKNDFPIDRVETLSEAVKVAVQKAEKKSVVLFSPGCSSFDQFLNYEHRGNEFKRIVEEKVWIEKKRS